MKSNYFKNETTPQEMYGLSFAEGKPNCFKKETTQQEMQGLCLCGSEAKLFEKRNNTPKNVGAKPSQKRS
jgi:hypothetical protein